MPGLIDTLQTNPAAFLSIVGSTPIYVGDPDFTQAVKSHFDAASPASMFKIVGCERIAFASLDTSSRARIEVSITGEATQGAQPCYWLPWSKDAAVQIKLKPGKGGSKAHHRATVFGKGDSSIKLAKDRGAWKPRDIGADVDPDLFFTGMMDGCSVWVSGNPAEPLVYHINRASHENPTVNELQMKGDDKGINALKSNQMERDFKAFNASGGAGKGGAYGKVTPATEKLRNPMPADVAEMVKDGRSKVIRTLTGGAGEQTYYIQKNMTTVFGARTNGVWSFYKQDVYEYRLYGPDGRAERGADALRIAATRPEKFFP